MTRRIVRRERERPPVRRYADADDEADRVYPDLQEFEVEFTCLARGPVKAHSKQEAQDLAQVKLASGDWFGDIDWEWEDVGAQVHKL